MRKLYHLAGLVMAFAFLVLAPAALALPDPVAAPAAFGALAPAPDFPHAVLAPVVMFLTWLIRKIPGFLSKDQAVPILAALTIATFVVELVAALVVGRPETLDLAAWLPRLWEAAITLLAAAGIYGLGKKAVAG